MKKVGVVGAGVMGAEIAYVVASNLDTKVYVRDISEEFLAKGRATIERVAKKAVEKGKATEQEKATWLERLNFTLNLDDLADADVVIEAVSENIDLKRKVFAELDSICTLAQFLASNTSGLPITVIAAATKNPERVIGTHFFNPASIMKLVEIVTGYETSAETLKKVQEFCTSLGKETVVSKDYPGFISTRIGQAYICDAIRCLEQGVGTVEDIDRACRLAYNHPMGPLELADLIGLDTELMIMESLSKEYGEAFRPTPLVKQMVAAGRLGRKTGKGFYDYTKR